MPIVQGDLVTAASYNNIRNQLYGIITTYYGYISPTLTKTVSAGSSITVDDWQNLYLDLSRCYIHQTNQSIPGISQPTVGSIITANFASTLETIAVYIDTNKDIVHPSQLSTTLKSDTRSSSWGSAISSRLLHTWNNSSEFDYFLNLGGAVQIDISYPSGSYSGNDLTWKNLFDTAIADLNTVVSGKKKGTFNKTSPSSYTFFYSSGSNSIEILINKTSTYLDIRYIFEPSLVPGESISVLPTVRYDLTYSYINTSSPSPYGIPSPLPFQITATEGLNSAGWVIAVTKILTITPGSLTYSFDSYSTSVAQNISYTNIGNTTVTVSSFSTPSPDASILVSTGNPFSQDLLSVPPGQTRTVSLQYQSTTGQTGSFSTTFSILSDNQQGTITIPVNLTVSALPFSITLSPSSWTVTATTNELLNQQFSIIPSPGTSVTSFSASLDNNHNYGTGNAVYLNFGPFGSTNLVTFNPFVVGNGTYVSILTITANFGPFTATATATLTLTKNVNVAVLVTKNLGNWISAAAYDNSVMGFSYNMVDNVRYLTIGFGTGVDGAPNIGDGGESWAQIQNLWIGADEIPNRGPALYTTFSYVEHTTFLNTYGTWVRNNNDWGPFDVEQLRVYDIYVDQTNTYEWTFAADNTGFFAVDGIILSDRRWSRNAYSSNETGTVYLTAGYHTVLFGVINYSNRGGANPGKVGILIYYSYPYREIWSTLFPVRTFVPYPFWAEVYRIPLTGGAKTYNPKDYVVKNGGYSNGDRYGSLMVGGDLCTVVDDGNGNLDINFASAVETSNNTSLANLYLPWYYTQISSAKRVNQLETPQTSQTRFFLGFTSQGEVRTSLVPIPNSGGGGSVGGGGVGCPAPWLRILLSDGSNIKAKNLKPGMMVRTQHEYTLEWGNYVVSAVSIITSKRIEIQFEDVKFVCSDSHKFYHSKNKWVQAYQLVPDMIINGHRVLSVSEYSEGEVVKITVDLAHTYICEGILSHNIKYEPRGTISLK